MCAYLSVLWCACYNHRPFFLELCACTLCVCVCVFMCVRAWMHACMRVHVVRVTVRLLQACLLQIHFAQRVWSVLVSSAGGGVTLKLVFGGGEFFSSRTLFLHAQSFVFCHAGPLCMRPLCRGCWTLTFFSFDSVEKGVSQKIKVSQIRCFATFAAV